MPPWLMEEHALHSQSVIGSNGGKKAMMGGLCRLVVMVRLCGLVVGLVVRIGRAGCLCGDPLQYLLSCYCKAHKHKCAKN
jgi:hypothetical protein